MFRRFRTITVVESIGVPQLGLPVPTRQLPSAECGKRGVPEILDLMADG
jgi:hypothetical protein